METQAVGARLKALREAAGLTVGEMATAIGRKKSSYQHYEDRYKRPTLPPELAADIITVLRRKGIPKERIDAELTPRIIDGPTEVELLRLLLQEMRLLRCDLSEFLERPRTNSGS